MSGLKGRLVLAVFLLCMCGLAVPVAAAGVWAPEVSHSTADLLGVSCPTPSHCAAVGRDPSTGRGVARVTVDGGMTWSSGSTDGSAALDGVSFADSQHGWAVGADGTILGTSDGGATWTAQDSGTHVGLSGISCPDISHCWAVGYALHPARGVIESTADGGQTWVAVGIPLPPLVGVFCQSSADCWAAGYDPAAAQGVVLATGDGGVTWTTHDTGAGAVLNGVFFTGAEHGWAVGSGGTVRVTSDGGQTWSAQDSGTGRALTGVSFAGPMSGWISGGRGTLLTTSNGGRTWTARAVGTTSALYAVTCLGVGRCWAVGAGGTILRRGPLAAFADVPAGAWYASAASALQQAGIVEGVTPGRFDPGALVTRAQLAVILARAAGLAPIGTAAYFRGLQAAGWYAPRAAYRAGLVSGIGSNTLDPNGPVTREQLGVMLALLLPGGTTAANQMALGFTDASTISPWARSGVAAAVGAGLLSGYPDGTFRPLAPVTRAQVAAAVYLYLQGLAPVAGP